MHAYCGRQRLDPEAAAGANGCAAAALVAVRQRANLGNLLLCHVCQAHQQAPVLLHSHLDS